MPTTTHGIGTASTANAATYAAGSFTPAANDLLIVFVTVSGNTGSASWLTDTQNLGFDLITSALKNTSADKIYAFVAKKLAANSAEVITFHVSGGASATGAIIQVARVSGMTLLGLAAIKQSATVANHASGSAPAPVFGSSVLTGNVTLGVVGNSTSPATMTPPTSWTEDSDLGYATPTTGAEYVHRDSGFTGTTVTWGNSSASAFGAIIIELSANAGPATPTLSSPANAGTVATLTPELDFLTTDPNSDTIRFETQVDTVNTFNSATATTAEVKCSANSGYFANTVAESTALNTISYFTFFKWGATGSDFTIFQNGIDTSFGQGYALYIAGADGSLNLDISFVANLQATNLIVSDTNEHFAGFTCDPQGNWTIYLDNAKQAVGNAVPFGLNSSAATSIGAQNAGSGSFTPNTVDSYFSGSSFWERELTESEILNLINRVPANKLANQSNLVIYLPFTNGASLGANSGSGAALTKTGTVAQVASGYPSPLLEKVSGTDAGYGDITTPAATDPFPSGDSMKYTIQAGDALVNTTTYFWRVRAYDPTGSGIYSAWSTVRSFTVTTGTNFTKSLTDSVTLTETLKRFTTKKLTATITLTETLKRFTSKTLTVSITLVENLKRLTSKKLTMSITLTEFLKKATGKTLSMSVSLIETLTKHGVFFRSLNDSITLHETLQKKTSKTLTTSISLNEFLTKVSGKAKTFTDSITLTEKLSRSTGKRLTATITLNESLKRATAKKLTAIITLTETLTKHAQFFRSLTDSITLHETLKRATSKKLTMSVSLTETLNRFLGRKLTDSITLHEFLKKSSSKLLTASVTLVDRLAKNTKKTIVNTVSLNEKLTRFMTRSIKDTVSLTEFFSRSASFFRTFHDSISLTDRLKKFTNRNVTDNVTLNESLKKLTTKRLFESVSLIEFFSKVAHTARSYVKSTYSFLSGKRTSDQFTEKRNTTVLGDKQNSERVFFKKDTTVLQGKRDSVE